MPAVRPNLTTLWISHNRTREGHPAAVAAAHCRHSHMPKVSDQLRKIWATLWRDARDEIAGLGSARGLPWFRRMVAGRKEHAGGGVPSVVTGLLWTGLDSPPRIRHPGTGHGAGRRTGSTPVASNAGPVTTRSYPGPQFRGNPTPPRPSDCLGNERSAVGVSRRDLLGRPRASTAPLRWRSGRSRGYRPHSLPGCSYWRSVARSRLSSARTSGIC